jgi:hypothetical protein
MNRKIRGAVLFALGLLASGLSGREIIANPTLADIVRSAGVVLVMAGIIDFVRAFRR